MFPTTPKTYRLVVAYDGTDYFGWQVQPGLRTIQGTLKNVVREVTGEDVLPQGAGRTDSGVHASGQSVSLNLSARIPADRLCRALNHKLPAAIRVVSVQDAEPDFHARANVLNKTYEYRVFQRRPAAVQEEQICSPVHARYVWDCRWRLCLESMQRAASVLEGTHNFASFAATDPDRAERLQALNLPVSYSRTIFASAWHCDGALLIYRVTGDGFLHHMVRNIVGTCVEIGSGRRHPDAMLGILQARQRSHAGATAPPQGLHLLRVVYKTDHTPVERVVGQSLP